ncbi:MAG TPA: hypothetical protein VIK93_07905 [Limnochordales bacterium]
MANLWRIVGGPALALALLLVAAGGQALAQAETSDAGGDPEDQIIMEILDEDALLLVSRAEGRDVVRVLGRNVVRHRQRVVWSNQLEYDEEQRRAVATGDVELVDEGDEPLELFADYVELDLDNETAFARGHVRFTRDQLRGSAEEMHYGDYALLQAFIEEELRARRAGAAVETVLAEFLPDDAVLVLMGAVHLNDGDREISTDFVVHNTRSEALFSVGRSAARLPGPEE